MNNTNNFPKLHPTQWMLLNKMKFKENYRFNEIKPIDMDPHKFTYHLKQLIKYDLIDFEKGRYFLTDKGKLLISFFIKIPKVEDISLDSYILLYVKHEDNLLVVKRNQIPYLGYIGVPCVFIKKDEFIAVTAKNGLHSIGLIGDLSLSLIIEVLYKDSKNKIKDHACIYTFYIDNPKGEVSKRSEEGELSWIKEKNLLKVEKGYDNSKDLTKHFESKSFDRDRVKVISRTYFTKW